MILQVLALHDRLAKLLEDSVLKHAKQDTSANLRLRLQEKAPMEVVKQWKGELLKTYTAYKVISTPFHSLATYIALC